MKDYPLAFLTAKNKILLRSKELSEDGTPRYIINPKCPENSYCLKDCLLEYTPLFTKDEIKKYDMV